MGGNEDFDVTSKQFGFGGGFESHYNISNNLKLLATAGLDYYLGGKLQGHDTAYNPDNVNPQNKQESDGKYSCSDTDKVINQPKFMPRVMVGVQWDF